MSELTPSPAGQLPSTRTLLRSTALAAIIAGVLLITVVMPAEYGVDPTGIGRVLGLTEMGEIKVQLAREAAAADAAAAANPPATPRVATDAPPAVAVAAPPVAQPRLEATATKADTVAVVLQPNEGKEIKLAMAKGARVTFSWSTDRGVVNYDTHADRTAPPAIKYHGYGKGQGKPSAEGELVAAFDGMHGWFWRNRTREVVTVTLRTSGDYRELKRME